jgi:glycine cleavage system aminomethyltransferase T/glycine/D-amino acid oxidase-like deaminating enzyme
MLKHARVVIIGSGIVGCAAAYHLARSGWRDIVVLDKGALYANDGSTSHAPGGVGPLSHSRLLTQMGSYTSELITSLDHFSPDRNTWNKVGQLEVAATDARMQDLTRLRGAARAVGHDSELLSPAETVERLPLLAEDQIAGSLFVPHGLIVRGADVSGALARDAMATGSVEFLADTEVTNVELKDGTVVAVLTNDPASPRIECEQVLLATNIWAPVLAEKLGFALPLMAFEHQYVVSRPLGELAAFDGRDKDNEVRYPLVRELDSSMYYRQHWDGFGIGSYRHETRMVAPRDVGRTAIREFTLDDFMGEPWARAQQLVPALRTSGLEMSSAINGMFAFSIDGMPIIGPSPIRGLWTAVASWITHAGGVGKSVAEWMVHGEPEWDMRQVHISRFHDFQTADSYVAAATHKNYREVYDIVHPRQPLSEPRDVRRSPFAPRLDSLGAEYKPFAGLELADWFNENEGLVSKYRASIPDRSDWAARYWSPIVGAEHLEMRANVGLMDLTGLALIEVSGPGALAYVGYLCSNVMDVPVGRAVYTLWLTERGGVRRDLTVTRMAADRFWLHVGEGTLPMDLAWAEAHAPVDGSVEVRDRSESYTALGLWGPNARRVLENATSADVSNSSFPYFTGHWVDIDDARVYAVRMSYVGELGWELHIPMEMALPVWDRIWEAGREFHMPAVGLGAMESMRLEKGYRLWGRDVHTEYDAYAAGLGWTVKLDRSDFLGREASIIAKAETSRKRLSAMTLEDGGVALGYEAIYVDGEVVSYVTTAEFGYSVGKYIAYGYLPSGSTGIGQTVEIEYLGQRYRATVVAEPIFDPGRLRTSA